MRSRAPNVVAAVNVVKAVVASAVSVVKAVVASVASVVKVVVVMVVVSAANVVKAVRRVVTMHPRRAAMTLPVAVASVAMRN
ncbi:hypothetical protein KQQSB11_380434 [Klebsiella quasipneumoniae subsp. quasipneumoniae]|nr:hypothetical protein KQQSB11_380434 [Klebsiella quasipneumoniae subsp. quasipneumoniae]